MRPKSGIPKNCMVSTTRPMRNGANARTRQVRKFQIDQTDKKIEREGQQDIDQVAVDENRKWSTVVLPCQKMQATNQEVDDDNNDLFWKTPI